MSKETAGKQLKDINRKVSKKERFLRTRMWFSTFISTIYNDRGVIPPNIGNNILVGNNMYITKNGLSAYVLIREFSEDTPVAFISHIMKEVKDKVNDVVIDFTMKNKRYWIDTSASGLKSRVTTWERTLDNPNVLPSLAKRSARLLYTVDVVKSGEKIYQSRMYITVRAKTGSRLQMGIKCLCESLDSYGISYKVIKSNMQMHLDYVAEMSNKVVKKIKDVPRFLMSNETIAEILPSIQGLNDENGTLMGIDMQSLGPYYINFRLSANAKNIYIAAQSGFGKTFLALNWIVDMYANDYNLCIMDIKGTEFAQFTKAVNGKVLSQRTDSTFYVNTFRWIKSDVTNDSYRAYADTKFNLSKQIMLLICDIDDRRVSKAEALIEEFLKAAYTSVGVLTDNPNTWSRTDSLTPYVVYEMFDRYLSHDVMLKYSDVAEEMRERLKIYMFKGGSRAYMFRDAYSYKDILDTRVLTFDFGLLETSGEQDPVMFKLRVMFMNILNDEFVAYKKSKGEWTVKVLEESQIVKDYILDIYVKEITMGRARNQINIMLGNSISSLVDNPKSKAAIENINIMCLGVLNQSSKDYVIKEFNLSEGDANKLDWITDNPDYDNVFLFINRMQKNSTTGMIRAFVPDRVRKGKLFKVVDTVDEE